MALVATPEMAAYCFDSLRAHLDSSHRVPTPSFANEAAPLFVTWKKADNPGDVPDLRGCIGTFADQPLHTGLAEYAVTAGVHDSRFPPISKAELPKLTCAVSLLTQFEDAKDPEDWTIGTHGIIIKFRADNRSFNATYLPEVMPETGWSKRETLTSLARKAGYRGKLDDVYAKIALTRYQSSKTHMTYDEYVEFRK